MENSQNNLNDDGKKPSHYDYVSVEELIARMRLAFSNAKEPEILSELQTVGYSEAQLDGYLARVAEIETLDQRQAKEYGEQYEETKKFNAQRDAIDAVYTRHKNLSKIAFKKDRQATATLALGEGRKRAYPAWLQQVKNFYAQILANADISTRAAAINIKDADIAAQQQAIATLEALKVSQKKETGEAQKATETRDHALDELYPEYSEFLEYAKELFKDDQTLEKLGIVVKR